MLPPDAIEERMDDDPCLIKVNDALRACNIVFGSNKSNDVQICMTNIKNESYREAKKVDRLVVLDVAFDFIMRCWYRLNSNNC